MVVVREAAEPRPQRRPEWRQLLTQPWRLHGDDNGVGCGGRDGDCHSLWRLVG
ncbi:hypothetical protein Tco_0904717, partial [Tanacetum coccineum]